MAKTPKGQPPELVLWPPPQVQLLLRQQQDEVRCSLQEQARELARSVADWAKRVERSSLEQVERSSFRIVEAMKLHHGDTSPATTGCSHPFFVQEEKHESLVGRDGRGQHMASSAKIGISGLPAAAVVPASAVAEMADMEEILPFAPEAQQQAPEPYEYLTSSPSLLSSSGKSPAFTTVVPILPEPPETPPGRRRSETCNARKKRASSRRQNRENGNGGSFGASATDEWDSEVGDPTVVKQKSDKAARTEKAKNDFMQLVDKGLDVSAKDEELDEDYQHPPFTVAWLARSKQFAFFVSLVILLNALSIGVHAQYLLDQSLDDKEHGGPSIWDRISRLFTVFFAVEILLRIFDEKVHFVTGAMKAWNIFDSVLVMLSLADWLLAGSFPNLSFIRVLRVVRSARILRLVRVLRAFHSFRVLIASLTHSVLSLGWVLLLLFLACYTFAVLILYGVVDWIEVSANRDSEVFSDMKDLYGSVPKALLTLFMGISGGVDWGDLMLPLLNIHWLYAVVWVFYIFSVVFGMLNVVTGVFVARAHELSMHDREIMVQQELALEKSYAKHIIALFREADKDGNNNLSLEELERYLQDPVVSAYFSTLQLEVSQARSLFHLLDLDESNAVGIDEFVTGCMRLRGSAKSIDVNMLLLENEKMVGTLGTFMEEMAARMEDVEQALLESEGNVIGQSPRGKLTKTRTQTLQDGAPPRAPAGPAESMTKARTVGKLVPMSSNVAKLCNEMTGAVSK